MDSKNNIKPLWGKQTSLSLKSFNIGDKIIPIEFIRSYAYLKKHCAIANNNLNQLDDAKTNLIIKVSDEIIQGKLDEQFPLHVWQTGSGTQTNMNLNEVISNRAKQLNNDINIDPNDDVNMSQSSNDTFPTAMKISTAILIPKLLKAIKRLEKQFRRKEIQFQDIIKVGRTHLQDATPIYLSDEISSYSYMLKQSYKQIKDSLKYTLKLPIGGTAVGNGINCHKNFSKKVCKGLEEELNIQFKPSKNKFHGLTSHDSEVYLSGALNALASNLMKIANDIRWLSSGPNSGLGELIIPANEKGSSIMPGKVNPTQSEAITMIAVQVMGNHTSISIAASQGNFELNVFKPMIIYNLIQSIKLLTDGINSFNKRCIKGLDVNRKKIKEYLDNSLMIVTALNPHIGYKKSEKIAKYANKNNLSIKESAIELKILTSDEYDKIVDIIKIAKGNNSYEKVNKI